MSKREEESSQHARRNFCKCKWWEHRAWLLRQDSCPLGVLWNYYGDAGRGDTQEEMDAYNEFNTYGEFMDNPVAPWFANGDDENGGPDASTYFMG